MTNAITEGSTGWLAKNVTPNAEITKIIIYTFDEVDDRDTIEIDLAKFGIQTPLAVQGFEHSTSGQVIVTQAPTSTIVSGTAMTIDVGGSSDNRPRMFIIWGLGKGIGGWAQIT